MAMHLRRTFSEDSRHVGLVDRLGGMMLVASLAATVLSSLITLAMPGCLNRHDASTWPARRSSAHRR